MRAPALVGMALVLMAALAGCATSTGVRPSGPGPDTWFLSEMRAPAVGGGDEARRVVLAESEAFCRSRNKVAQLLEAGPDGDPYTPYYPTAYTARFECRVIK